MTGKNKPLIGMLLGLLFAAGVIFISLGEPVWAEDGEGDLTPKETAIILMQSGISYEDGASGIHEDIATFQKNFSLTPAQKQYTITECERVVNEILDPDMSDLEKYYTLAIWAHKRVIYDWEFWNGGYYFDYYSHQWDAYGGMEPNEKSVCVGIAIFYSNLCHAADLPCRFVRLKPDFLDHTINYIPDINGNAYYVDVTENNFLMSEDSNGAYTGEEPNTDSAYNGRIDNDFAKITRRCTDKTFDFIEDESWGSTQIRDWYPSESWDPSKPGAEPANKWYDKWFKEYALHENTTKTFGAQYDEKGSGTDGERYASYSDYPANFTDSPDIWFLDDFYEDPDAVRETIKNKVFDKQLLNISGIDRSYDCDTEAMEELVTEVANDIEVQYFPSADADGNIIAEPATLTAGRDFTITFDSFNTQTHTAILTLEAKEPYSGEQKISVKMHSAIVAKEPSIAKGLTYDGDSHELVTAGEPGEGCEMRYALGTKDNAPEDEAFSAEIPKATNAGKYYVWYKAVYTADETDPENPHADSIPQRPERPTTIAKKTVGILTDDIIIMEGESATASPRLEMDLPATFIFENEDPDILSIDENGVITGKKAGYGGIYVVAVLKDPESNYAPEELGSINVTVVSSIDNAEVALSKSAFTYNGKVQKPSIRTIKGLELESETDYTLTWSNKSSKNAGTYTVTVKGEGIYTGTAKATYTIAKAANPMKAKLKKKKVKVKAKKLRNGTVSVKRAKYLKVTGAKGKVTYKKVTVEKKKNKKYVSKKKYARSFKVNKKTGKITISKGVKKGTYRIKVNVTAKGNANYKKATKDVTFKIRVK